jgi:hypothetical protein
VRVAPEKVRVLLVDGYPRYEYRFLKEMLKRADENIQLQVFLLSANPDYLQDSTRGVPALREVPTDRKTLLDDYDVIILGDVNPWSISPDPARCEEFLRSAGGVRGARRGLLLIAGEYDNPRNYISTPLEPLFPSCSTRRRWRARIRRATTASGPSSRTRRSRTRSCACAPTPRPTARCGRTRAGSSRSTGSNRSAGQAGQPGAAAPSERGGSNGRYPLLVAGYYPAGRTLFSAIDSTWRWRKRYGDLYHERFWRAAIRWLALGRLRSGDRRYRIEVAQSTYDIGASVAVEARVLDEDFQPSTRPVQEAWWSGPDGRPKELTLPAVPTGPASTARASTPISPGSTACGSTPAASASQAPSSRSRCRAWRTATLRRIRSCCAR